MADRTYWNVALHPRFGKLMERINLSPEGEEVATYLAQIARQLAGHLQPVTIAGHELRIIRSKRTYLLSDGRILPPVRLFCELSDDGSQALILGAMEYPTDADLIVCGEDYQDTVRQRILDDTAAN